MFICLSSYCSWFVTTIVSAPSGISLSGRFHIEERLEDRRYYLYYTYTSCGISPIAGVRGGNGTKW